LELVEDSPVRTDAGMSKRWVVVRSPGAVTGLLLARADGDLQRSSIGAQYTGRIGLFLRVDDFDAAHQRMLDSGVSFVSDTRNEPYGRVAVFIDVAGNRWDLLRPPPGGSQPTLAHGRTPELSHWPGNTTASAAPAVATGGRPRSPLVGAGGGLACGRQRNRTRRAVATAASLPPSPTLQLNWQL
jgi:hypothetical protein